MLFLNIILIIGIVVIAAAAKARIENFAKLTRVFIILLVVSALLSAALIIFTRLTGTEFFLLFMDTDRTVYMLLICASVSSAAVGILSFRSKRKFVRLIYMGALSVAIAAPASFTFALRSADNRYRIFTSPDKMYSVIAREESFLLAGHVRFYERVSLLPFISEIGSIGTDDGYRTIDSMALAWDENRFTVKYNSGNGKVNTEVLELSYPEGRDTIRSFGNGRYQIIKNNGTEQLANCKYHETLIPNLQSCTEKDGKVFFIGSNDSCRVFSVLYTGDNHLIYFIENGTEYMHPLLCGTAMTENKEWTVLDSYDAF